VAALQSSDVRRSAILDVHAAANDSTPLPMVALMLVTFEEQMGSPRSDEQGYEKTKTFTLNELFSPEYATKFENRVRDRFAPHQLCDECGERMVKDVPVEDRDILGRHQLFCQTLSGFKSNFISEWCEENRQSSGEEAGLPNIMAKLNPKKATA
jgi:hypothetical protein